MTTSKPDVQALIEEARTYLVQFGYRNTLIGRLADALEDATALSALSGETETETLETERNRPHYEIAVRGCDCGGCFGEPIPEVVV